MPWIDRRLIQNFDWTLLAIALGLAGIGVINLVSAASQETGGAIPGTAWRQLMLLGVASLGLLAALAPDYRTLERFAIPFYVLCMALLVAVLVVAPVIKGSQRWLVFGPVRLQPSELTKLAMVLLFARLLNRKNPAHELGLRDLAVPALLLAVPFGLVLRQPDLGTSLLIVLICGTFVLLARVRLASIAWLGAGGLAVAGVAWFYYLHDYQKERLLTFLNPERDPLGSAYHAIQSQIAIGSGGIFGRGFRNGPQSQLDFLPEQQTDFVFPVLAEEWGFVGATVVMLLYLALMVRGLLIARASKDAFGAYLAVGVVAILFWAGAINLGMVLGVLPVVGVPLPLLSYGGSSLVVCMVAVGLLLNVSMRRYVF